ncbi:MAG: eukaryotic-like serine/threonine-protein kinase [Acidobacteriota bacterium]|jgi:serine/threonine-protein kinase|nr:eukaryotic-like serine/threonine-protein kinase [Acidobacteriota bacterium]
MKYCPTCQAKYEDSISFCALDGEVLEDDATHIVGSTLDGQYNIESLLGKGGMGAVYRARHILLGDKVAIKILPPQMRNNAEWLRRFRREGQAARRFRHPNAVTVYDLRTTSDGLIYMVMEFVEGHTLDAELKRRGRFTAMDAYAVLEPVMSVLNAAHAMGVVHRDLKPENIMLGKPGEDGQVVTKLLDLGIAKMREIAGQEAAGTTALTIAGQVLGTPFYMSPEQWGEVPDDGNVEIDGRADIYSLGVVIYELIAGRRPFLGLTLQELRREHVSVTARPLHELVSDVPEAFSQVISRTMSKDRNQRQTTAGELSAGLRAALGLAPLSGSSPSLNLSSSQASAVPQETVLGFTDASESTHDNLNPRNTSADVIGPTIITMDSPPKPQGPSAPQPPPLAATSLAQPMPSPTPPPASYTPTPAPSYAQFDPNAQAYTGSYAPAAEPKKSSSRVPIIIAAAILLVGGGIGGWYLLSNRGESRGTVNGSNTAGNNGSANNGATTATLETLSYWLEIEGAGPNGDSARVAGVVPLASEQSFKFHFTPKTSGYLYIIGPGPDGKPMTFLTAEPAPDSGVDSNSLEGGVDYTFPENEENAEHWVTLDKKAGTETYTVIMSPSKMATPAFLDMGAGHELTDAEVQQLDDLKAKYKANPPQTAVSNGGGTEPSVSVKVPQAASSDPVIFDVRIEHK